jgi:hypothetical protein
MISLSTASGHPDPLAIHWHASLPVSHGDPQPDGPDRAHPGPPAGSRRRPEPAGPGGRCRGRCQCCGNRDPGGAAAPRRRGGAARASSKSRSLAASGWCRRPRQLTVTVGASGRRGCPAGAALASRPGPGPSRCPARRPRPRRQSPSTVTRRRAASHGRTRRLKFTVRGRWHRDRDAGSRSRASSEFSAGHRVTVPVTVYRLIVTPARAGLARY